ncbi:MULTISPECIES: NrsF family protein [unclassified Afipia]|uniref:NrsF family protein n=1 Tax=unclassified Afipia TaxID=2642050 RepID=UPI0004A378FD|nr:MULTISPECIES: NrsF family protein [unclassified Afipia]
MDTDKVIERLVDSSTPVRRLARPWVRAVGWLAVGMPYVALVVLVMAPRPDLLEKLRDVNFSIEQTAALLTAISAAIAAFATTVPGYDRKIVLLPLAPLGVWLGSLGQGCIEGWIRSGSIALAFASDWFCIPAIILVGTVPAIAMAFMLRRGAPLRPHITVALGGLAAAGLGNFGLRLFHAQDASLMVLVWQMGTVVLLTILCGWAGQLLLSWKSLNGDVRRAIFSR